MDFTSAREWLDEMAEINATAYARDLLSTGKSDEAVVRTMMLNGISKSTARKSIWYARQRPHAKPMAPVGSATGKPVMVRIAPESVEVLREAAAKRIMSLHLITSKIIAIVVEDEMINAVLDDQA